MRALLDQKDAVRSLRLEVKRAGSQKEWAKKNGVTQSLISMVLSGDRPPNNKIISALKLRRVVVYERLDRTAGRPSAPVRGVVLRRAGACHDPQGEPVMTTYWNRSTPRIGKPSRKGDVSLRDITSILSATLIAPLKRVFRYTVSPEVQGSF